MGHLRPIFEAGDGEHTRASWEKGRSNHILPLLPQVKYKRRELVPKLTDDGQPDTGMRVRNSPGQWQRTVKSRSGRMMYA